MCYKYIKCDVNNCMASLTVVETKYSYLFSNLIQCATLSGTLGASKLLFSHKIYQMTNLVSKKYNVICEGIHCLVYWLYGLISMSLSLFMYEIYKGLVCHLLTALEPYSLDVSQNRGVANSSYPLDQQKSEICKNHIWPTPLPLDHFFHL